MRRTTARTLAVTAVVAGLVTGCTVPDPPVPAPTPTPSVDVTPTIDTDAVALAAVVVELRATLDAVHDALERAVAGDGDALTEAASLLVADVSAVTGTGPSTAAPTDDEPDDDEPADDGAPAQAATGVPAPLLPGPETSRLETVGYGDLLTRTLALARGAGAAGEPVQRLLADPLAGDLGAWQRAPADLLRLIGEAGAQRDLDATGAAVLALDGEVPRALAWVVHGLTTPDDAVESAGRALAHLAVVELAMEQLP